MAETKLNLSDKSSHRDKSKSVEIFYFDPFFVKLEFGYSCDTKSRPDLGITQKSATLICLLRNENKRYQHRTKTKLTRKIVAKNKRKRITNKQQKNTQLARSTPK